MKIKTTTTKNFDFTIKVSKDYSEKTFAHNIFDFTTTECFETQVR